MRRTHEPQPDHRQRPASERGEGRDPTRSEVGRWLALQRVAGNHAVHRLVRKLTAGMIQRRGENPYAPAAGQTKAHEGWELTAHHIVAHSTLVDSFKKLSPEQQKEIVTHAVPATITDEMLENLKVVVPQGTDRATFKIDLRAALVSDQDDNATISGIKLGDMRSSFFEWQGGNQFLGPNTSIRTEPGSKDDIDFDGRYFTPLAQEKFEELTAHGTQLKKLADPAEIVAKLHQIIDIARDSTPRPFDASDWVEIATAGELTALASKLNRKHMPEYAFFKIQQADAGAGKTYRALLPMPGGEYHYGGLKAPVQIKGTMVYIPVDGSKPVRPPAAKTALETALKNLDVEMTKSATTVELTGPSLAKLTIVTKKFKVPGYVDMIPAPLGATEAKIVVPRALFDGKQLVKDVPEQSLYEYCLEQAMPTSSYLPKALYESLQPKAAKPQDALVGPSLSPRQDAEPSLVLLDKS